MKVKTKEKDLLSVFIMNHPAPLHPFRTISYHISVSSPLPSESDSSCFDFDFIEFIVISVQYFSLLEKII